VLKISKLINHKTVAVGLCLLLVGAGIALMGTKPRSTEGLAAPASASTKPTVVALKGSGTQTKPGKVLSFSTSNRGLAANSGINTASVVSNGSSATPLNGNDSAVDSPPVLCHIYDACGAQPADEQQGIYGTITIGPITPVCRIDIACDGPYSATIIVSNTEGEVTRFTSDSQGHFWVNLLPGNYMLSPAGSGRLPWMSPQSVIVSTGLYTQADIQFDSGIR
jgi:hypothetical protein